MSYNNVADNSGLCDLPISHFQSKGSNMMKGMRYLLLNSKIISAAYLIHISNISQENLYGCKFIVTLTKLFSYIYVPDKVIEIHCQEFFISKVQIWFT